MRHASDPDFEHLRGMIDWPDLHGTRYTFVNRLGIGGMGSVFLVEDAKLARRVALKVLTLPDDSGELTLRMIRGAKIVAQLEHPGIVPIHDVGQLADGRVYYTMKFVQGKTLEEYCQDNHAVSHLLRLFGRICEAVDFAHARGVIHRDLKPANIMIGQFGEVLVMDWGVATQPGRQNPGDTAQTATSRQSPDTGPGSQTVPGAVIGTPAYISPEQAAADSTAIDRRTDIYGLGGILHYILTRRPPRSGDDAIAILAYASQIPVQPAPVLDQTIARRLSAICRKALAHNQEDRYPDAAHLAEDIDCYLDDLPVSAYRDSIWEKIGRWLGRNRVIVLIIAAYIIMRFLLLLGFRI